MTDDKRRVTERFQPGDAVDITFGDDPLKRWWPGTVDAIEPPGVWVTLLNRQRFWVTNGRRIRPRDA